MRSIKSLSLHLLLFVIIEIIFVFLVFHELPETSLFTTIGLAHLSYWLILLLAGLWRERAKKVIQRFLATYLPVVYHLFVHFRIGIETLHVYDEQLHTEHEAVWITISVIIVGILIYRGEVLLHRTYHCDTHHHAVHKKCCQDGHDACETKHK